MVSLRYIFHDCFILENEACCVVFDYWKMPDGISSSLTELIPSGKSLYVLVSHFHKDHFNPEIFSLAHGRRNVRFILSKDTARHARKYYSPRSAYRGRLRVDQDLISIICPGESYADTDICIRAYGSTDTGNSYAVEFPDGKSFFHAGDLNAWHWRDESSPAETDAAIKAYRNEIEKIRSKEKGFDAAMFPVDARIGSGYYEGAYIFVREFDVRLFVPMHFCLGENKMQNEEYIRCASDFDRYRNPERGCYAILTGFLSSISLE